MAVKGLGRKKADESEYFTWKDDVKVPCGRLISSGYEDSSLEYNEYAVYDPKQVRIKYLVSVKLKRAVNGDGHCRTWWWRSLKA